MNNTVPKNKQDLIAYLKNEIQAIESHSSSSHSCQQSGFKNSETERKAIKTSQPYPQAKIHSGTSPEASQKYREEEKKKDTESFEATFQKIQRLCLFQEQCSHKLRTRLLKEGYKEEHIERSLEQARSCGLLDDLRYAEMLVRSRLSKGRGIAGIERELEELKLDLSGIPGWPESFEEELGDEKDRARKVLEKQPPHSKNLRESAYRKLVSRGFSNSVASSVARQWAERHRG